MVGGGNISCGDGREWKVVGKFDLYLAYIISGFSVVVFMLFRSSIIAFFNGASEEAVYLGVNVKNRN